MTAFSAIFHAAGANMATTGVVRLPMFSAILILTSNVASTPVFTGAVSGWLMLRNSMHPATMAASAAMVRYL